ncbi:hypothetical protein SLS62_004128 [Diatrype stigma]|uniref:Chromatin modification-related protein EAF3 n=1 Tax=Diatrype stigma TaxID=117547 RepID=A0AAN9UTK4_9PEZI
MAPSKHNHAPPYAKEEKVLCFHGDLMYEAKIIDIRQTASTTASGSSSKDSGSKSGSGSGNGGSSADDVMYRVHYKGWKASWDDWVTADRIRKFTDDNKQLASQLRAQATMRTQGHGHSKAGAGALASAKKAGGPGGKAGSEMSSARGSEERAAGSSSFAGRGPRRGRDYELESVRPIFSSFPYPSVLVS